MYIQTNLSGIGCEAPEIQKTAQESGFITRCYWGDLWY
jgi:hypothetical protein